MCKNQNSESAGTLTAQEWLNEAQKHLTDPASKLETQLKCLERAVQCIIYACRQFRERAGECRKKSDRRIRAGIAPGILKERRQERRRHPRRLVYPGDQPFKRMLDTIAKVRKELEAEKEKSRALEELGRVLTKESEPLPEFLKQRLGDPGPPLEADNWKHRSLSMRCKTCMSYVPKSGDMGRCRRHAPTLAGWPVVYDSDWCNDHKIDENKRAAEPVLTPKGAEETVVSRCLAKECRDYNGVQGCARKRTQIGAGGCENNTKALGKSDE